MTTPQSQCTNLELSKKLKELGYPQESLYIWVDNEGEPKVYFDDGYRPAYTNLFYCSAPTVAELGNKLYEIFDKKGYDLLYKAYGECFDFKGTQRIGDIGIINLMRKPDMAAKMLIYLLENKLIEL